jgi:P-type Ca2+ transporter type 2C
MIARMPQPSSRSPAPPDWHALDPDETLRRVGSVPHGLSAGEAARRLASDGPNAFRATPPVPAWRILLRQLKGVVTALLVAAAAVALLSGDRLDAGAIGAVLLLNVLLGFVTELRAHRAMEALLGLEVARARVIRDGTASDIDARELVVGDVIEVEPGQRVPADARLLDASELRAVEAPLTGEPVPVDKVAHTRLPGTVPLPDRVTMLYKSTTVVHGTGRAVAVATGMNTEVGRIGALTGSVPDEPTPLEQRLDALGRRLVGLALLVALAVVGLGLLRGLDLADLVQMGIALAVAAVPEGLPAVATITMAVGMRRMLRRNALVRRLAAVETLGSATVICTDKTGTLTAGEMTAVVVRLADREVSVSGEGYQPAGDFTSDGDKLVPLREPALALALRIGALANRGGVRREGGAWRPQGDPTEAALVALAAKARLDPAALRAEWPEVAELPFSSERLLMATFHRTPRGLVACVKGAPGRVLARCTHVFDGSGPRPFRDGERESLATLNRALASRGLRVLALATGAAGMPEDQELQGLTWVALVGLADPPASGVQETVDTLHAAGIRTVMLTGDQKLTAESVAGALGLVRSGAPALDGAEVDALDDNQLREAVARVGVFSRVSPETKLRIVDAFRRRGEIVAMLGDGVNDAPALRKADLGAAMGIRGTDLAKEAADIVLVDDRFPTVAAAVEEGRVIFDNIRKFVFYLFSCNLAEILVLFGAIAAGLPAPLSPLQILWLNLLTDTFPALALAVEPGEPEVMRQPPRDPGAALLSGRMLRAIAGYGSLIAGAALGAYAWGLAGAGPERARTMAFMALAFAQIFHLGNARGARPVLSPARALRNRWAVGAVALSLGLQIIAVAVHPLARVLGVVPLGAVEWAVALGLGMVPAFAGQALKTFAGMNDPSDSTQARFTPPVQ